MIYRVAMKLFSYEEQGESFKFIVSKGIWIES